jgi:hypothetical protein
VVADADVESEGAALACVRKLLGRGLAVIVPASVRRDFAGVGFGAEDGETAWLYDLMERWLALPAWLGFELSW